MHLQYTQEKIHVDLYQISLQCSNKNIKACRRNLCSKFQRGISLENKETLAHRKALTPNPNPQKHTFIDGWIKTRRKGSTRQDWIIFSTGQNLHVWKQQLIIF